MDEKAGRLVTSAKVLTPEKFAQESGLDDDCLERLNAMDKVFLDWSSRHNLVAKSTIEGRWHRHYLDSAQILKFIPGDSEQIVDLGSGAGFPGLIIAAARPSARVTLIESVGKKAAFLTAAADAMGLREIRITHDRIEKVKLPHEPQIITARALARLAKLLAYGHGIQGENTKYVLMKGQDVDVELTQAAKSWHMSVKQHQSRTDPSGVILEISNLTRG